ncbi:MAG TPA: thiamine pyrophosphate-dependent enzyme [Ferruginibacter sp.]|nr:thiamine pyrophosphate-dependent enzyme [Ferruginibacter sp.]HMP20425.1 thiamine pyrophosphate-dependent enzyme [Ferruginibacter sp.]
MPATDVLLKAYELMCAAQAMAATYDANRQVCKYVHATSRGHEAIQLAVALNLLPCDYVSPYYRDESLLLGLGFTPQQLMLQLLAKGEDIFSGGRSYYAHPSYNAGDKPTIIHQSSATGMQAIPTTGIAHGLQYLHAIGKSILPNGHDASQAIVVCSMGDASVTEGEVSETFQFAALHQLPIIYLVQDNNWGISVSAKEARTANAYEYVQGFKGIENISIDGTDFEHCFYAVNSVISEVRQNRKPYLIHARVPLLGHHTSGVRKEFYRSEADIALDAQHDPLLKLRLKLLENGFGEAQLIQAEKTASTAVVSAFEAVMAAAPPAVSAVSEHVFAPTTITTEKGERAPAANEKVLMVDAAMLAIREIMEANPEAILYGQDVGLRLGGVFREAATLAEKFGSHRVFNTAIQEAYIIGSTAGLSATGLKPIVEVQFADYLYPGLNQLVSEIAKSCYLTNGKFPVQTLIRVPVGAYGGGGPYHSGSIETTLLSIKGIKVVYPSNAADMKGLFKAAFADPNPVIMLEHKGLYWSKIPGTEEAKCIEPSSDYIIPLGKANIVLQALQQYIDDGESCCVVTYGMGVYWAKAAAKKFSGRVEVIDLRTLFPLDESLVFERVKAHGKCLVLTEEQQNNSFAEALAWRISKACFTRLDAAVDVLGALDLPAVPIDVDLEKCMLPNADKVAGRIEQLLKT